MQAGFVDICTKTGRERRGEGNDRERDGRG